ncbi:type VII secretion protein EccCb [Nocardioides rotundus]|uniref:type VII secretion protein EccCb n=1 Tax=Nocardioides rotundus TaxID=1774216 RepID=UPI001CC0A486|nr:type VII secretion protein EccCb [Nocardioides rotundus]UAL29514.1 type VII secretion protein EccCb [Nocardioides rotundus]
MTTTPSATDNAEPALPAGELTLRPPPRLERGEGAGAVLAGAVPMIGTLGSILLVASLAGGGSDSSLRTRSLLAGGVFLLATLAYVLVQVDRQRRQQARQRSTAREDYLHHLACVRASARAAAAAQRQSLVWHHPDPSQLAVLAGDPERRWRRGPDHSWFLRARVGCRTQPATVTLTPPAEADDARADPAAAAALHRLLAVHAEQPGLPANLDLRRSRVEVAGPREQTRALARALLCQAAVAHAPEHLAVAVHCTEPDLPHWDWVKWLPHATSPHEADAAGPRRLVGADLAALTELVPAGRHLLVIHDGTDPPTDPGGDATHLVLTAATRELAIDGEEGTRPDRMSRSAAEAVARRLAPWAAVPSDHDSAERPLTELLGLADVDAWSPDTHWRPRPGQQRLRVPIGTATEGGPLELDLKEAALGGMGPHGLLVGATGSGKSELLRTLVLALALTHSPDELNLVLVDFKGGATFADAARLPHTSALITNLSSELSLVDRMADALTGELLRRQELLREAGNHASIEDYRRARAEGAELPALPSLFIVVDEFSELLSAQPELVELFVAIGRLGRSLGLHLLLASQRLDEGRLRGLESHLSYRIGLRTFSAAESRAVLGVPDAHRLRSVPGLGFLQTDAARLVRFRAAFVSGAVAPRDCPEERAWAVPFTVLAAPPPEPVPDEGEGVRRPALLHAAIDAMAGLGPEAHRVWLPPLDTPDTLDGLLRSTGPLGRLTVPVGIVDRPREQRREPLLVDLSGAAGHVAVVGAPRSGRSTLLQTLMAGIALTHAPDEATFYALDLGGGGLASLAGLPHLAGVAGRTEPAVVRRIVAEVAALLERRERDGRGAGGDVFLVVDGWVTLREEHPDLEQQIHRLADRGLAYGVHLVAAAGRWSDFRSAVRDLFGTRLELRLGDPVDSEVDRRLAGRVPADRPGRGLLPGGLHYLTALPRVDGDPRSETLAAGVADLTARVARAWPDRTAPRLRLLPERVDREALPAAVPGERRLVLGVDEDDLAPVLLDPDRDPHLLVIGDGGSGRTATLRGHLHELLRTRRPDAAQVVLLDPRRTLLGEVPEPFLLNYLTSADEAEPVLRDLAGYLGGRLPGEGVTPDQLRQRSWWSGAEVHVVVDDADLLTVTGGSPLAPLRPLLARAGDVGLHLVVALRSGGATRTLMDPALQALRDLGQPVLLLAGDPDDGPLLGRVRPEPGPPGRGQLVTRGAGTRRIQVAWSPPTEGVSDDPT